MTQPDGTARPNNVSQPDGIARPTNVSQPDDTPQDAGTPQSASTAAAGASDAPERREARLVVIAAVVRGACSGAARAAIDFLLG